MWASWAFVSLTLATAFAGASVLSGEDEQPATDSANAMIANLPSIGGTREICAVPPAAAQRLEQGCGVGEAIGLGLDETEACLLICLLSVQHGEISGITVLILDLGEIEAGLCGVRRGGGSLERLRIVLERGERIRDILEGHEHGAAILLCRLLVGEARGALLMKQGAA